jgi:peptide/nickel transport system substrate-binding protein/oligopeptide transport system substrate-binding protein
MRPKSSPPCTRAFFPTIRSAGTHPAVAAKWELSEDKRTWTFTLREGARYWNGDPVLAAHFRDAWLSLIDPAVNSPYSSLFDLIEGAKDYRLGRLKDKAKVGITASEERTLVVKLVEPAAFFPSMLCHHSFAPVHPSMRGVDDWSARPPISNGPFYIVDRKADRIVMAKNELYWDAKRVDFKGLVIRFAADGKEAASLWDSGEARWIAGDIDLDALRDRSGVQVNAMFATHYYYVRSEVAPWNDRRVSRALSLALEFPPPAPSDPTGGGNLKIRQ